MVVSNIRMHNATPRHSINGNIPRMSNGNATGFIIRQRTFCLSSAPCSGRPAGARKLRRHSATSSAFRTGERFKGGRPT